MNLVFALFVMTCSLCPKGILCLVGSKSKPDVDWDVNRLLFPSLRKAHISLIKRVPVSPTEFQYICHCMRTVKDPDIIFHFIDGLVGIIHFIGIYPGIYCIVLCTHSFYIIL